MEGEILVGLVGIASSIITGVLTHFLTRRKYNSEVDNNVIENMKQSLEFYTKLSDDNKARLDEALKRNDMLEDEVRQLRTQMFQFMNNICLDLTCSARQRLNKIPSSDEFAVYKTSVEQPNTSNDGEE